MTPLLSFILVCLVTAPALATTVLQLSFSEVVDHAELIFEGHVSKVETIQTGPRSIHTRVTFDVINVIKGSYLEPEISLQFLGGEVDGRRLVVQGMQVPETGETGIFFVESLQEALIHPLVGWSQGHFLLELDTQGESRVLSAGHAPVTGLVLTPLAEPASETSSEAGSEALEDSIRILSDDGAARGVIIDQALPAESAMSAGDFRAQVQLMLELQQQVP
ncbi:MAG: hypothetical protein Q8L06_18795 [Pseudohongiella sp.]|nr:hypothetical protein [Pseudohongiella sp.]